MSHVIFPEIEDRFELRRATGPWNVLRVQSQREGDVQCSLMHQGVDAMTPYGKFRRVLHRPVMVDRPLFPGYVFVRIPPERRTEILQTTPFVFDVLAFAGRAAMVEEDEIERIRRITYDDRLVQWPHLVPGKRVRIILGHLQGLIGEFVRFKNEYHVVVNVQLLNRAVSTVVDAGMVEAA